MNPSDDGSDDRDHYSRLRTAQAESVLGNIGLTLASNIFVACTTAYVVWTEDGRGLHIIYWLGFVVAMSVARFLAARHILIHNFHREKPDAVLRFMALAALFSGLSWTPLPLYFAVPGDSNSIGYVAFVMAGMTAGAIIQSLCYSRMAIAFGVPVMSATLLGMCSTGDTTEYFLASNMALLTLILLRASVVSERAFAQSQNVAMRTSQLAHSLAVANSEINKSTQRLQHLANSDVLTGLANRAVFNKRMEKLFAGQAARQGRVALLLIDLDKFKTINDTRGHHAGDAVLKAAARRLAVLCSEYDMPIRLGGDEFAVILSGADAAMRAEQLAANFMESVARPIMFSGQEILIGASIGIACAPLHAADAEELYACADLALYCAKVEGRRRIKQFDDTLKGRLDYERSIDRDLAAALDNGALEVHFQPQVEMARGRVTGFEALIRWWHPEIGAISPPDIVASATKLRLSERLTGYVAERACNFVKMLDARGETEALVSINMSPSEFELYCPATLLMGITARHGIPPRRIEVEITEDAILDPHKVESAFSELRNAGFALAVDDFGMGHSSLAHLISLKIDRLKIDRHFVTDISTSTHNQALVAALVSVGRSLDMELVMEGVETMADADTLRALGCRTAQGWLYGKAMSPNDVMEWLNRHSARIRAVA